MKSKTMLKSKTIWLSLLTLAVSIASFFIADETLRGLVSENVVGIIGTFISVAGVIIRLNTSASIDPTLVWNKALEEGDGDES